MSALTALKISSTSAGLFLSPAYFSINDTEIRDILKARANPKMNTSVKIINTITKRYCTALPPCGIIPADRKIVCELCEHFTTAEVFVQMNIAKPATGIFYGIGVGPGDPELVTVKAINAIKNSNVIIAPKTEKKDGSVALTIAKPYLRADVEIVYQTFPMVRNFEEIPAVFEANQREILNLLAAGKNVAFLTLGDPMFYSTYIYIFRLLKNSGVTIETIPGVPAFLAIAAKIGRPLAFGNDILTVIPATASHENIAAAAKIANATVVMKVYKNFPEVVDILAAENMTADAVLVSRCGLPNEKILTNLEAHKADQLNYLSTILTKRSD